MRQTARLPLIAVLSLAAACSGGPREDFLGSSSANTSAASMPTLPWGGGTGALSPWGGTDASRWRPEAVMANAASEALNDAWAQPNVREAIVAIPVRMLSSNFFEFGDGQSNAAPSFEWWGSKRPPVVATLIRANGSPTKIHFRFDRDLPYSGARFVLHYTANGTSRDVAFDTTTDAAGNKIADVAPPAELALDSGISKATMLVHPDGWNDWFPLWFRFPVRPIADFKATVPAGQRAFADGGDIQDHEKVGATFHQGATDSVRARLQAHAFGATSYAYFNPQDIHAIFPFNGQQFVTGVGQGWTWVADQARTPFKIMYTCFEHRRTDYEANAPNGGVPSGGGWHKITDPAETVMNDLESGPIVLGSAMSNPIPASTLPSGGFAYNLSDVATVRFVQPGEAFITPAGGSTTDAAGRVWDQSNFHWYFFHQTQDVCTEEWVHPTRPNDNFDFGGATVSVRFQADNATTSWGQNVYAIGDAAELGAWNVARAVKLAPTAYPNWSASVTLPQNGSVQFKFIKIDGSGNVVWESGPNRAYTSPAAASGIAEGTWRN